ncbi:MAG TPA: 50S ribosomal protein L9 [Acidimicrobiia bacterium]|nr:50S ribosomal protein L9 [Acidimicrobiia bacterium]
MKVVLRADVETLGNKGDLLEVSDGYARNYLVPRGLAIRATKGIVKQAEAMRRNRAARDARDREAAQAVADQLAGRRIEITARAGEGGRLFGSVTSADVATAVQTQVGVEIDRRHLSMSEPLKELGPAEVPLRIHSEVEVRLQVEVVAE